MKTITIKSTLAALITASTLVTTGVAPMNTAQAEGLILNPGISICKLNPSKCLPGGGPVFQPPVKPLPPVPPKPKGGLTDGQKVGLGILGAVAVGALVANSRNRQANPAPYNNHLAYCHGKYKTFDPNTNTFMSNAGYRKPCISPYM